MNEIPTFNFYANPSDQPYVMLDGDDWLMDAAIGRLPVENDSEARALINKTINYERFPNLAGDTTWQTRSLMVAGIYASDTPGYTVDFCGEMLQDMGFPQPTSVESPPLPSLQGAQVVRGTINNGRGHGCLPRLGLRHRRLGSAHLHRGRHSFPGHQRHDAHRHELRLPERRLHLEQPLFRRGIRAPGQPRSARQGRGGLHRQR